jgi:hypothetical protein
MVLGRLNSGLTDNIIKIIADKIIPLEKVPVELTESFLLQIDKENLNDKIIHDLKVVLKSSPGKCRIYFEVNLNGSGNRRFLSNAFNVKLTYRTLSQLDKILGYQNIKVKTK